MSDRACFPSGWSMWRDPVTGTRWVIDDEGFEVTVIVLFWPRTEARYRRHAIRKAWEFVDMRRAVEQRYQRRDAEES